MKWKRKSPKYKIQKLKTENKVWNIAAIDGYHTTVSDTFWVAQFSFVWFQAQSSFCQALSLEIDVYYKNHQTKHGYWIDFCILVLQNGAESENKIGLASSKILGDINLVSQHDLSVR